MSEPTRTEGQYVLATTEGITHGQPDPESALAAATGSSGAALIFWVPMAPEVEPVCKDHCPMVPGTRLIQRVDLARGPEQLRFTGPEAQPVPGRWADPLPRPAPKPAQTEESDSRIDAESAASPEEDHHAS